MPASDFSKSSLTNKENKYSEIDLILIMGMAAYGRERASEEKKRED
jgi:hypothetical protein